MNTSSDDSLNTGVTFRDAFFPYVERTSCKTPPNPPSPFSVQVFLFVFLTGIMQEILVIRVDCVLSQPVYITVPSLCVCVCVRGQLYLNSFTGMAFNSVFTELGSSAVDAIMVQTVTNPLAVVLGAARISVLHLKVAQRQLAPLDLLTVHSVNPQLVQKGCPSLVQSGGGLTTAHVFVGCQVLLINVSAQGKMSNRRCPALVAFPAQHASFEPDRPARCLENACTECSLCSSPLPRLLFVL